MFALLLGCARQDNRMTDLDRALDASQHDQTKADAFYNLFLNSDIFIPTYSLTETNNTGIRRSEEGESFTPFVVESDGTPFLPIFDTIERLQAWAEGKEMTYVRMPAHAFIRSSLDPKLHLALNVGTSYFKEFIPDELDWLRQVFEQHKPSAFTVPAGTKVFIGAPARVPDGLVDALAIFMKRNVEIEAAYLGQVHFDIEGETPQLFLVLKMDSAGRQYFDNIKEEIGVATRGFLAKGEFITMQVYDGTGIGTDVVATVEPFYTRTK